MPMVKVPHGLLARALAITTAIPAMQRIFRKRTAKEVATPVFWPNLCFCHFGDGFTIVTHGAEEDDHVMDSTGEDTTD